MIKKTIFQDSQVRPFKNIKRVIIILNKHDERPVNKHIELCLSKIKIVV